MSNRQQRRSRHLFIDDDGVRVATALGEGTKIDGDQAVKVQTGDLLDVPAGEHLWIFTAAFRCARPELASTQPAMLDSESLLYVGGPGCYHCEQIYTAALAAMPCPGDPS